MNRDTVELVRDSAAEVARQRLQWKAEQDGIAATERRIRERWAKAQAEIDARRAKVSGKVSQIRPIPPREKVGA